MSRIIAVVNQKGGVGKSTTALALGTALADRGQRVLLIDLDPQGSLTNNAGVPAHELKTTVYTVMAHVMSEGEAAPLASYVQRIEDRLDLLPSNIGLGVAEMELQNAVRREYVLAEVLAPAHDDYDAVLVDCAPSLGLLTINALTAAHQVLIPVEPEYPAAYGLGLLMQSLQRIRKTRLNPQMEIAGIILTMVDYRTSHGRTIAESVKESVSGQVPVLGEVKRSIKVSEAAERGVSIIRYAPSSETAHAYEEIAERLLRSWGIQQSSTAREPHSLSIGVEGVTHA